MSDCTITAHPASAEADDWHDYYYPTDPAPLMPSNISETAGQACGIVEVPFDIWIMLDSPSARHGVSICKTATVVIPRCDNCGQVLTRKVLVTLRVDLHFCYWCWRDLILDPAVGYHFVSRRVMEKPEQYS